LTGLKKLLRVSGDHNSPRAGEVCQDIAQFFANVLSPDFQEGSLQPGMAKRLRKSTIDAEPIKPVKPMFEDSMDLLDEL
jgi:hypothetical protein